MDILTKTTQLWGKTTRKVAQHSPAILTGAGVVGLGATAYLSYKASKKVEAIVEDLEEKRETLPDEEINKAEVVRDLAGALALPVLVGVGSVICIGASYQILNNRNNVLAGALGVAIGEHQAYRQQVRDEYGEEVDQQFAAPTEKQEFTTTDSKGKEKVEESDVQSKRELLSGRWFDDSFEYTADDHSYNMAYINAANEKLQLRLFQRGYLLMNEVLEELGFERTRSGALFGWSTGQGFDLDTTISKVRNSENGMLEQQIWVHWTKPQYIYDKVEFEGRYSVSGR